MSQRDLMSQKKQPLTKKERLEKKINPFQMDNALFDQAIEVSGLGIWQYDIVKNKTVWSKKLYEIYELDPKAEAPNLAELLHFSSNNERERIEKTINEGIQSGKSYVIDCSIKTQQGKIKHLHATGKPVFDQENKLTHLMGTVIDITERKNLENALLFADYTIESFTDSIFWIDENAKFYRVNDAACIALGYTREELIGKTGADINPDFTVDISQKLWDETKEKTTYVFETIHKRKDGSTFPVEITNNVFEYEGREFRCSIVRNITDRIKKRQEVLDALNEVERLKNQLEKENSYLKEEIKLNSNFDEIVSKNRAFHKILHQVEQVANSDATVLITGESGTGKELLARAVHHLSNRKERPLIKINCATLPANLIESELFGHEKGAFTGALDKKTGRFEMADKGTIFLDEIGELPLELQPKLLRVLQEGEFERLGSTTTTKVHVRIIAATNRDLEKEVSTGNFREDLFYRLNVFPIESPTLRSRKEDIPILVNHFISKYSKKLAKKELTVSKRNMELLMGYEWPGNIRELENVIERAMIVSFGSKLDIGDWFVKKPSSKSTSSLSMEEVERNHIIEVLKSTNWRVSGKQGAANILKMNAKTLDSRMRKLNIQRS